MILLEDPKQVALDYLAQHDAQRLDIPVFFVNRSALDASPCVLEAASDVNGSAAKCPMSQRPTPPGCAHGKHEHAPVSKRGMVQAISRKKK